MKELISVIVPVYKVEKYLRRCIDSILNQTHTNLEVILVDDGSPDNCGNICDEYAKKDQRIKVIHKENGGLSSARNAGLKIATGNFVAFVDSDDTINEKQYEVLYNLIKKYNADISICELVRINENANGDLIIPESEVKEFVEQVFTKNEALKQIMINGDIGNFACTKLFKLSLFTGITFPDGKVYEDVATTYKLVDKSSKIVYTNQKLYYYLHGREGAITSSFSEKKIFDSLNAYYSQYKFIVENYSEIRNYANITWAKMYTSAMEKTLMNNYTDVWNSEFVKEKYESFKDAVDELDASYLENYFETYRLVSVLLLRQARSLYESRFNVIFDNLKNK